ncbi:hypothetical protein ACTJKC_01865 [Pedobacter sp. 22226]|uniref:hypothetical protein n=1 Tax=Pedobacter sp. 22226 TaxID=3453894 RepID=UPI003F86F987
MGSWGTKALYSDEGLDIINLLVSFVEKYPDVEMGQLIAYYKAKGFLAPDDTAIDYLYDTTAIALSEIYLEYQQTGRFTTGDGPLDIRSLVATKKGLQFLMTCLDDIIQEKPDEDGEREYVDIHRGTPGWTAYIRDVYERLNGEYMRLECKED